MTEKNDTHDARLRRAKDVDAPQIYANGFSVGITGADTNIVLERNGEQIAIINMSFTLTKTLAIALGGAISSFEQVAEQELLTTHDVDRLFTSSSKEGSKK